MDSVLLARIDDAIKLSDLRGVPKFVGFLNEIETATVIDYARSNKARFQIFGGYEDASRVVFCALPDWADEAEFPITQVTFKYRKVDKLSHRDFLGTLMSIGITRESVGDILVGEGRAVAFILQDVLSYVTTQIEKVGGVGVEIIIDSTEPLPLSDSGKEVKTTVASARLDAIVAHLSGTSREKANEQIKAGNILVNQKICINNSKKIIEGDQITIRKKGKFYIKNMSNTTKKGRIILVADYKGS